MYATNKFVAYGGTIPAADMNGNVTLAKNYITVNVAFDSGVTGWTVKNTTTALVQATGSASVSVVLTKTGHGLSDGDASTYALSGALTSTGTVNSGSVSGNDVTLTISGLNLATAAENLTVTITDVKD